MTTDYQDSAELNVSHETNLDKATAATQDSQEPNAPDETLTLAGSTSKDVDQSTVSAPLPVVGVPDDNTAYQGISSDYIPRSAKNVKINLPLGSNDGERVAGSSNTSLFQDLAFSVNRLRDENQHAAAAQINNLLVALSKVRSELVTHANDVQEYPAVKRLKQQLFGIFH